MGIKNSSIRLLMREGNRKNFTGKVIQLGRQEVLTSEQDIEKIAREENFKLSIPRDPVGYGKSKFSDTVTVDDKYFFQRLGFEVVDSLDASTFEGANIIHDLNKLFEKEFKNIGSYSLVYDGGTLEHVFHIPNALKNIFDLLSVNGRIMHTNPINFVNHGFYNFCPCFYEDFYKTNNFLLNECRIIKDKATDSSDGGSFYTSGDHNSQFMRSLNPSLLDGAAFETNFIATKLHDSTGNRVPQKAAYVKWWDPSISQEELFNMSLTDGNFLLKSIYKKLLTFPILKTIAKYLRDKYANSLVRWEVI